MKIVDLNIDVFNLKIKYINVCVDIFNVLYIQSNQTKERNPSWFMK
ncbi:MAG: hypothetical protein JWN30_1339 [Bacilli bacterium]|nr:hypothetical protein [Bacilli bacterium]